MRKPGAYQGGNQHGKQQGNGIWRQQSQRAFADFLQRLAKPGNALGRQAGGSQVAAHDQENLHGYAGIVRQPVDDTRGDLASHVGHRAIEGQVMPHDGRAACSFDDVQPQIAIVMRCCRRQGRQAGRSPLGGRPARSTQSLQT
ncbi:hypothetical protein D3C72_1533220 [compost metagenome]